MRYTQRIAVSHSLEKIIETIIDYFKKKSLDGAKDNHYIINEWIENDSEKADFTCENV